MGAARANFLNHCLFSVTVATNVLNSSKIRMEIRSCSMTQSDQEFSLIIANCRAIQGICENGEVSTAYPPLPSPQDDHI